MRIANPETRDYPEEVRQIHTSVKQALLPGARPESGPGLPHHLQTNEGLFLPGGDPEEIHTRRKVGDGEGNAV
jgi:hypothetical protein